MHIFSSRYTIKTLDGTFFLPHLRYVLPDGMARDIEAELRQRYGDDAQYRLSHFNSYERRYAGQPMGKKESLLIYRHGAIGDTLMTTAVVKLIRQRNPEASIDLYCRPGNAELWHGLGANVLPGFPPFDAARNYTHHLLFENGMEADNEDDQGCAIDNMLAFAGINPWEVSDEEKLPVVVEREQDGQEQGRGYIVVQANASNPNRTYPHMEKVVEELSKDRVVIVVGDGSPKESWLWQTAIMDLRGKGTPFRHIFSTVKNAALVICPDSSIGHLAAAFPHVPVISLWGLFDPNDRIKYYRNHHPITGFAACPHAPCRSHEFKLPHKCKDAPANQNLPIQTYDRPGGPPGFQQTFPTSCAALASITPEMVVAKAKELLCAS